jgi:uncharacterized membrane protein
MGNSYHQTYTVFKFVFREYGVMAHHKTLSFAIIHMAVAFSVVYLMTGSWALGGAVALIEPAINTVAYFFHEKAWELRGKPSSPLKGSAA